MFKEHADSAPRLPHPPGVEGRFRSVGVDACRGTRTNPGTVFDVFKASLSGPTPISRGAAQARARHARYAVPAERAWIWGRLRDGYLPIYSRGEQPGCSQSTHRSSGRRSGNDRNGLLKWTWNSTPVRKLSLSASRQFSISQGFDLPGEGYRSVPGQFRTVPRLHRREHDQPLLARGHRTRRTGTRSRSAAPGRGCTPMSTATTISPTSRSSTRPATTPISPTRRGKRGSVARSLFRAWTAKGVYSFYGGRSNSSRRLGSELHGDATRRSQEEPVSISRGSGNGTDLASG